MIGLETGLRIEWLASNQRLCLPLEASSVCRTREKLSVGIRSASFDMASEFQMQQPVLDSEISSNAVGSAVGVRMFQSGLHWIARTMKTTAS